MTALLVAAIIVVIGLALLAIGLAGDWDIDEQADITDERSRLDGLIIGAAKRGDDNAREFWREQAAAFEQTLEPDPRYEPNSGIWRRK